MAVTYNPNNSIASVAEQASSTPVSLRESFIAWLSDGKAKKISPQAAVSCIDKISEYVVSKRISCSIWEISKLSVYKTVFRKVIETKLLRILQRDNYKTFTFVRQLYGKFLDEKPWKNSMISPAIVRNDTTLPVEESPQEETVPAAVAEPLVEEGKYLFKKDVDLSLLKYGFTIPQSAVEAFCSNISVEVLRGNSSHVILEINGTTYPATLSNVGFASENRQQMQVRYSQTSPIAALLRDIFASSNDLFSAGKQLDNKEYIEVFAISTDKYKLICHTSVSSMAVEKEVVETLNSSKCEAKENLNSRSNGVSKKYAPLRQWLVKYGNDSVELSFSYIAGLVGGLPPSAYQHRAFWSNTDSHPLSVAWMEAGYRVVDCDLQSHHVRFSKVNELISFTRGSRMTVKAALIEFSSNYKGQIKTRQEIVAEISAKYGHNEYSILPADYEVSLNNRLPKLFKRIDHGTYVCLGYNAPMLSDTATESFGLISDGDKEKAIQLVATKFKNGFRKHSSIDFERFTNYYSDEYGEDCPFDTDWLNHLLTSEAFVYDDRAYIYSEDTIETIRIYMEQTESLCIFIDAFFSKYSGEFYTHSIFSATMLKAFIEKNYRDISVKYDYILMDGNTYPADLIKEVFSERETWSFEELQDRLPFVKMDTIKQTMNSAEYFRVDRGTYTHIDNMDLPSSEGSKIVEFVECKLQDGDYVTANELDLSRFENLNPHCPFAAVRDSVFYKFLSGRFEKSGQVVTRKGQKLRVLDIMEQYCLEANSVTFEELNAFEATFDPDGRTHSQCLIAGHNTMVRVSGALFVSDSQVDFDVVRTDDIIALYCRGSFIPLKDVADFSLFPYSGYPWNLFLLESYLRRFSRIFMYDVRAVNSANIGAIVRRSFDYDGYDDILALALARSSIRLSDKEAVGNYLFDNGYIGWRNLGKSEGKILAAAKKLREGGAV